MRKINKYVLEWHDSEKNTGGVKAKQDAVTFLKKDGFISIEVPSSKVGKVWSSFWARYILRNLSGIIVIQYPSGKPFLRKLWLEAAYKNKKLKVILLIHDLESIRFFNDSKYSDVRQSEFEFIAKADGLVALNERMKSLLVKGGIVKPITTLDAWDYDNKNPIIEKKDYQRRICYAGNLRKALFLSDLKCKTSICVFGPNSETTFSKSIKYMGQFSPQELPSHLNGDYGLVWDGVSAETCKGMYGQYLRYNTPHKFSLYISSGLPVIVWDKAAIAEFVKKYNVGLTISNLNEIDNLLHSVPSSQYKELQKNVIKVAEKMRSGQFLTTAINELIKKID
ncbi:beta-1,6-galactofuranosyltransferase [Limosilactobacillus agrestimuris]|uniref:beta-1,6-galactofuranosyltransferase n=1 Tax=Limosilactobacillus agrestimuris TaxID=2941331 RepID=UPI0020408203|nr:beta-1,6-galactofuranosyltransferase [Limosilactobacillus agrestimuris]